MPDTLICNKAAVRDGRIITGKSSPLLSACSGAVLNAIKMLAGIPKEALLMSPAVLEPVIDLKTNLLNSHSSAIKLDDCLTALYICAVTDDTAADRNHTVRSFTIIVNTVSRLKYFDMISDLNF